MQQKSYYNKILISQIMIRQNRKVPVQNVHSKFELDQKKLVKAFIYNNKDDWIEYFTGFLFMDTDTSLQKINIKIRFSRHPHISELHPQETYSLDILTDQQGLYTLINEEKIKTIEKPEQKLLYLKIGQEGKIIALSFQSKAYCNTILEHFSLMLESRNQDDQAWNETNLQFLNASMKENLIYVDLTFMSQDRVDDFLNYFNQIDKALYMNPEKSEHQDDKYMVQFFETVKNVFSRANEKVILQFIEKKQNFQTVLKCLSYNPFGKYRFNYLKEFRQMTVINSTILNISDPEFNQNYQLITKIKFLKDVAVCTFIELSTQAAFNEIISRAHIRILQCLGNPKNQIIQKMKEVGHKNEEVFINVFCQMWEIFKAVLEDSDTIVMKEMFYMKWIQNAMFSETLSVIGRIAKNRQLQNYSPRFWQKLLQSMNPMLSYEWVDSQKIILNHEHTSNQQSTLDLMTSLISLLTHTDSNTKVLILDFIRVQIQISQNRKSISAKYLSYIFRAFVGKTIQCCFNEQIIEKYIQFIIKIYVAQPIRTRHFIIQSEFMTLLKPFMNNKFVFIMALKLLKTFIEVGDNDTFRYLVTIDAYDCLKSRYAENQKLQNITNSLFLSIFKSASELRCKYGKRFLQKIFFTQNGQRDFEEQKQNGMEEQKTFKRDKPTSGLAEQFDIDK